MKTQVIYHPHSRQILSIEIGTGREHDIQLAKRTLKLLSSYRYVMTDLGYYGLPECGFKLLMPIKKVKNMTKCKEVKAFNKIVSRYRIKIEHINCQLKHFKILSGKYRNRRKRFGLRMNLIAALVNWMNRK